jgi:carbon monoxide dehydrogenase subunit G
MFLIQLMTTSSIAEQLQDEDIDVKVQIKGENVIVDLSLAVVATRPDVWDVLTDFEHMASFVSNLKESKVVSNSGDTLNVYQRGVASYGPINFPFESTREIKLTPFDKMQSHMISGNMTKMDGTTQLTEEGGKTRIQLHTESIPGVWLPPIAGRVFIEHETRSQFQEIRNEIIKRVKARAEVAPTLK